MSLWEYNDVELDVDMEDVEFQEKYEKAFAKMADSEEKLQKTGTMSGFTRGYCQMFYDLFDDIFGELGPTAETCIGLICESYGMNEQEAKLLFENVWVYTFGVGALCATRGCNFSEEKLGQMLSTEFQAMMLLVKSGTGNTGVK